MRRCFQDGDFLRVGIELGSLGCDCQPLDLVIESQNYIQLLIHSNSYDHESNQEYWRDLIELP